MAPMQRKHPLDLERRVYTENTKQRARFNIEGQY